MLRVPDVNIQCINVFANLDFRIMCTSLVIFQFNDRAQNFYLYPSLNLEIVTSKVT